MPKVNDEPEQLRPYLFHGVQLAWRDGDKEAIGTCPWCGRERKFSVVIETGVWRCLVCNEGVERGEAIKGGNVLVFIRMLFEKSFAATSSEQYRELMQQRGILQVETMLEWQLARSAISGDWILPGFNEERKLTQLYRYCQVYEGNRWRWAWLPCPTLGHKLFIPASYNPKAAETFVLEGLWDSIALWEPMANAKEVEDGLFAQTSNRAGSTIADANVIGIPAAQVFFAAWCPLFAGKIVNLMCQNDHPKTHPTTGEQLPPASYEGMKRVAKIMNESSYAPMEINYLRWGENGYDPSLKSGYDTRDFING